MTTQEPELGIQRALFPDANKVVYEQPLSERIRSFLRLEYLFELVGSTVNIQSEWGSRNALAAMIDVSDLLARTDLKAELIKELDRLSSVLTGLQENPSVDETRLQTTISGINNLLSDYIPAAVNRARTYARMNWWLPYANELPFPVAHATSICPVFTIG